MKLIDRMLERVADKVADRLRERRVSGPSVYSIKIEVDSDQAKEKLAELAAVADRIAKARPMEH